MRQYIRTPSRFKPTHLLTGDRDDAMSPSQWTTYTVRGPAGLLGLYFEVTEDGIIFDGFSDKLPPDHPLRGQVTLGDRLLSVNDVRVSTLSHDEACEVLEEVHHAPKTLVMAQR